MKIDGSPIMVKDRKFYKRFDSKGKKAIPEGAILCNEKPDETTNSFPMWIPVLEEDKGNKWFLKAIENTQNLTNGTYEAMGPHFQGNTLDLEKDVLMKHGEMVIQDLEKRDIYSIKKWLENHDVEGIVFWNNTEPVTKIRRIDFGLSWNHKKAKNIEIVYNE